MGPPPQIIPSAPEVGVVILQVPGTNAAVANGAGPGMTGAAPLGDAGSALDQLMATPFGSSAASDAAAAGINVDALAAIGKAESNFQNVGTANGTSSAAGPWQLTSGTFMQYSNANGLGYTAADMTNPADNAQVASYVISSYANTVSQATQAPATVLQTYGAYVFGPSAGANIATAQASTPLSQFVSSQALANNNMAGWTVGQFRSTMSTRLGAGANETVVSST